MKIFITGGSGFLGTRVVKSLVNDGHTVFALARSVESAKIVEDLGATSVKGDLSIVSSFSTQLANTDVVVHCAAPVEFWGPWQKYQEGIINSTAGLVRACEENGVKRFIHVSSEAVLQDKESLIDVDESYPYPIEPNSYYGKAKKIAEEELLRHPGKMEIIILRPTFIWGPDCPAFDTLSKKVRSGQFVWIDQGGANFEAVHVDNVAEAVRLSLTLGFDRSVYLVTDGEEATAREFFENLFQALGLPIPKISLPRWSVGPLARFVEYCWKRFGILSNPPITRFDLAFIAMPRKYKIDRIIQDLNYKSVVKRVDAFKQLSQGLG